MVIKLQLALYLLLLPVLRPELLEEVDVDSNDLLATPSGELDQVADNELRELKGQAGSGPPGQTFPPLSFLLLLRPKNSDSRRLTDWVRRYLFSVLSVLSV